MEYKKAISLAIKALEKRAHHLAVDANLHDLYGANHASAITASQKRQEIWEAIRVLEIGPLAGNPDFVGGDWSGYEICTICGGLVAYDKREAHFIECQAAFLNQE